MQQLAIVHIEQISRKGEIKYFQIPLPGTKKKIVAVEASAFLFTEAKLPEPAPDPVTPDPTPAPDPAPATNSNCPNPGNAEFNEVAPVSTASGINTQTFQIGRAVNPGFVYSCGVYSVVISVTAVDGDTPNTIAAKIASGINNTSLATWSMYGSNNHNYKPTANVYNDVIVVTVDYQHAFFASGQGSCTGAPPPPPPPPPGPTLLKYDPLFIIKNNEKIGIVSLQSPDATDIFFSMRSL